jgi:hypothetical protein
MLHCDAASKTSKVICAFLYVDGATALTADSYACLELVFGNTIISRGCVLICWIYTSVIFHLGPHQRRRCMLYADTHIAQRV